MSLRFSDLTKSLFRRFTQKPAPAKHPTRTRLHVTALEDRTVPSVTVYDRDFEPNTSATLAPGVTATWSNTTKPTSPSGETFLGEFGNQAVTLTLNNLPAHNQLVVEFDLYLLRSWDGNDPTWGGPTGDRWSVQADGTTLLDTTFRNHRVLGPNDHGQDYGGEGVAGPAPFSSGQGAAATNTLGYTFTGANGLQPMDATYHFRFPVTHAGGSLTLTFTGSGLQGLSDESWGLDNVKVTAPTPVVTVEKVVDAWEDGREGRFRFTRTGDLSEALTVSYAVSGNASAGDDYEELSGTVEFAAGEAGAEVIVTPIDDTDVDPCEEVTVTIQTSANYVVGVADSASMLVVDDESQLVTVTTIADAFEDGANGLLRFTRTGDISAALTVNYTVSGTATPGTDYTALSGSVTFAAGAATADVVVAMISDTTAEETKTVVVRVICGSGYGRDPNAIDVVNLVDDDANEGEIGGVVWLDEDGDGIRESGEDLADKYSVALLDEFGNILYRTLTGSTGEYLFRGLIASTVLVQFYAPLDYNFTTAGQGSDASVDSNVNPETGRTDPITLTPEAITNLLLGSGFVRAPAPPELPDLSVLIRDKAGVTVGANDYLRVAKWEDAFEAIPGQSSQPRVRAQGALAGAAGTGYDFIDRDTDRFGVWVRDVAAWEAMDAGDPTKPANPYITANLSTLKADGTTVDDNATAISLTRVPDRNGWYWSDSQILVSNTVDDRHTDAKYLGQDDAGPTGATNKKGDYTFQISDRTHKIALGGKVKVVYTKNGTDYTSTTPSVKVEKTVKLHVTILRNKALADGGTPVIAVADVNNDIARLREIYAQAGIRVLIVGDNGAEIETVGNAQIKDPPPGVNLANGLDEQIDFEFKPDDLTRPYAKLTLEEKALFDHEPFRTPTDANGKNDVEVYYVNSFLTPLLGAKTQGESFPASFVINQKYAHSVVLAKEHTYMTLAHELMHILGLSGHDSALANPPNMGSLDRVNTIVDDKWDPVNKRIINRIIATGTEVIDSRRIKASQQTTMLNSTDSASLLS